MADNVATNPGTGGDTIAADDISGVKYQRIKIIQGADGTNDGDTSSANPLPVTDSAADTSLASIDGKITAVNTGAVVVSSGSITADTELTTGDLDTGAGTDTRAVVGLIGSKSGGGVLIPGDATKGLAVDLSATGANTNKLLVTPDLPSGASTGAKQDTGNTSLASIDSKLPASPATSGKQDTGNTSLASIDTSTAASKTDLDNIASAIFAEDAASANADKGIQALTVRKNTAASTSGSDGDYQPLITDTNGRLHTNVGNTVTVDGSGVTQPVSGSVTANNPADTAPATQNITAADSATTSTAQQNSQAAITGTPTASSFTTFAVAALDSVLLQITGTWVATLVTEYSMDGGTTYFTRGIHLSGTNYTAANFTSNGTGNMNSAGATHVRVRATAYTSGTATVRLVGSVNPSAFYMVNNPKIADGTTPSQTLAVDSSGAASTNQTKVGSTAIDTNSGTKSGGTQRVVIATDQPSLTNALTVTANAGTNLNTSALATEAGNLATIAAAVHVEDVASANADKGIPAMAIRDDTLNSTSGTEGDYEFLHTTADGALWVTQAPSTSNGWSTFMATSGDGSTALTSTAQAVKASAGTLGGWYIYNPNATATYVIIYNTAQGSVTVGTTNPQMVLCIPATSAANVEFGNGINFTTAISVAATTTGGGNTAPGTALEANLYYK